MAGATFVPVRLEPPDWAFDPEALRAAITPRTRLLLLNTPHNPTGKVFDRIELEQIAALAIEHDLLIVRTRSMTGSSSNRLSIVRLLRCRKCGSAPSR